MKNLIKLAMFVMAIGLIPQALNAQVDVDNRTGCDYSVTVYTSTSPSSCALTSPTTVNCPAGTVTNLISSLPPGTYVVAYEVKNLSTGGSHPAGVVGKPGCYPGMITVGPPLGCSPTGPTFIEFAGMLCIIRT